MPTPNLDAESPPVDDMQVEQELISLRSTLPAMTKNQLLETLSNFPSYDTEIELPRSPLATTQSSEETTNRLAEAMGATAEAPVERDPAATDASTEAATIDLAFFPTRSMLPALTALTVLSTGWIMGVMPLLPPMLQSWEVYASVPGAYGSFVLIQWIFGFIGGGYRLTNTQLIRVYAGPVPNPEPIDLATICRVTPESTLLEKCLAVGRIRMTFERDVQPELVLGPIGCPRRRALKIEQAAEAARTASVVGGRIAA